MSRIILCAALLGCTPGSWATLEMNPQPSSIIGEVHTILPPVLVDFDSTISEAPDAVTSGIAVTWSSKEASIASVTEVRQEHNAAGWSYSEACAPGGCFTPAHRAAGTTGEDQLGVSIACHEVGSTVITVTGRLTVTPLFGEAYAADAQTEIEVTCEAPPGDPCDDPRADAIRDAMGAIAVLGGICAWAHFDLDVTKTIHSALSVTPKDGQGDGTELLGQVAAEVELTQEDLDSGAADVLACGSATDGVQVVCRPSAGDGLEPGEYLVIGAVLHAPLSLITDRFTRHSFVLDRDGDGANNYRADPAFPNDWFQDSDTWIQLVADPGGQYRLELVDARNGDLTTLNVDVRVVIAGGFVFALIPADAFELAHPAYRTTAFAHDGSWGMDGGWWSGDLEPIVAEGLAPFWRD
jgi:hypothetical protein